MQVIYRRPMVGTSSEFDTVLELCQDQHRRISVALLAHENRALTVNDLTKAILKHNHHQPLMEVSEKTTMEVRLSLIHVHLPKLEALSLIEYDVERKLVEPTTRFDQLEPQLSAIIETDPGLEPPVTL